MISILVIEDDVDLNATMCTSLERRGFKTSGVLNAKKAFDVLFSRQFDLIISDIMMPGIDGFEFAETVRKLNQNMPIIFTTARDDFESKRKGFQLGIDDYMVKPIDLDELVLRVGALLRRASIESQKRLVLGNFSMDSDEHVAYSGTDSIELTVREFDILLKLLTYPKKTFTRRQLMDEFWDPGTSSSTRTVDVYITKIREKLRDRGVDDFDIVTMRGLGYKAVPREN
ncbi:MAG: response regulator transcription factor [Bifidobacteriaceae bacterium]|jgi:DNA-binding response OmpR family regulator|nr:response regulator transcription factor [Bifidobacteriaceae bacterium]